MKVFIVYCHPSEDSFTRNVRDAFIKGIVDSGNEYVMSDLYKMRKHLYCTALACLAKQEHLDNAVSRKMIRILGGIPIDRSGNSCAQHLLTDFGSLEETAVTIEFIDADIFRALKDIHTDLQSCKS